MREDVRIRDARSDERAWASDRYREIGFMPTAAADVQLVADIAGERVGLGRLVRLGADAVELSGIWTADAARGRGVARAMVTALLDRARDEREVWCVPFADLVSFYTSFGFIEAHPWPAAVAAKVAACIAQGQPVKSALVLRSVGR
jgi:GNAT superfamily N-acetyltransferase